MIDDEVGGRHVFVVDGSRLYELDPSTADHMAQAVAEHAGRRGAVAARTHR